MDGTMQITVNRKRKTTDGIFGILAVDGYSCRCVENLEKAIPAGTYDVDFTYSPRFKRVLPHIIVPVRDKAAGGDAGIRIHPANKPRELEGCVAPGKGEEANAVTESRAAFAELLQVIGGQKGLKITVTDIA
jgi:hypothetical protein